MRTTVGPLPPEVYWRRRLALLGILVVAFVGVRACAGGDTSRAGAQPETSPSPTATVAPDGTAAHPFHPTVGAPKSSAAPHSTASAGPLTGPCHDSELLLTAATSTREYKVGVKPTLIMTVRNTGGRSCARNLGPVAREIVVTSGPAHTWSTDDCNAGRASMIVTMKPGAVQTFTEIWDGKRSQPQCRGTHPVASAGTYLVQAKLGTLVSETSIFRLV